MGKVIEVYVRHVKISKGAAVAYDLPSHRCAKPFTVAVTEKVLQETDKNTIDLSLLIAHKMGLRVRVYDVSTLMGKFMAQFRGVKKTPTIIIENHRIEGAITKDKLSSAL